MTEEKTAKAEEKFFSEQEQDIIDYIKAHGSITQFQAVFIGVGRLSARVLDLRRKNVPLKTEMVTIENRKGKMCRVARYWLAA